MDGFYGHPTSSASTPAPTAAERFFAVAVLFFSTVAFWRLLQGNREVETGEWTGALVTNCMWVLVYLTAARFLFTRCSVPWRLWKKPALLLLPVPVAVASLMWSEAPLLTFLRCGALIGTTVLALYLALRFSISEIILFTGWGLGLAAIGSLIAAIIFPDFGLGTDAYEGLWLGAFSQKNELGIMMSLAFLVYLLRFCHKKSVRVLWLGLSSLCVLLIVKADSMTSLVICCVIPYLLWVSHKTLTRTGSLARRILYFGFPVVLLAATLTVEFERVLDAMGRDVGLTGRAVLWVLTSQAALEKPYLGHGYEAFWRGYEGTAGDIWTQLGAFYYYSHNGFLEISLAFGLVGLVAVLISLFLFGKSALRVLQTQKGLMAMWPWALLLYLLLSNLLEGTLMKSNNLPWLLYTITAFSLSMSSPTLTPDIRSLE
jgi:exopolysaccharide production protein ExoQ